ncbi:MAG: ribonuclease P protein component [Kiritimatiellae bacterium]|nr:ribonuclease P protein component [Kiritimatiellia bacterium]
MAAAATETPADATAGTPASRRRAFFSGKDSRILSRARFEELYAVRTRRAGRLLVACWAPAPAGVAVHRLGATAAKRTFRRAHERNRAKRLLRESFRLLRPDFRGGPWDLALVARRSILKAREPEVRAELAAICRAAGILP